MKSIGVIGMGAVGVATTRALLQCTGIQTIYVNDINFEKAIGEALDFSHIKALFPRTSIVASKISEMACCDIIILTAGVKSKLGESRLDLLTRNLIAAKKIAEEIEAHQLPKILMVVTNPVDIITEYFRRRWRGSSTVVFGTGTSLDSLRLRYELAQHYDVNAQNIHAWVVGEHGDSSVSLLQSARIGCQSLEAFGKSVSISLPNFEDLQQKIRHAAYEVIRRKGATCHAIGETTGRIVKAILNDEKYIFPISMPVEDDVCASLPWILGNKGPLKQIFPDFSGDEKKRFLKSVAILRDASKQIELLFS